MTANLTELPIMLQVMTNSARGMQIFGTMEKGILVPDVRPMMIMVIVLMLMLVVMTVMMMLVLEAMTTLMMLMWKMMVAETTTMAVVEAMGKVVSAVWRAARKRKY